MKHYILIQSAHENPVLSKQRLEITQETSIRALESQTRKPIVKLLLHDRDVRRQERLEMFESTGCPVEVVRMNWRFSIYGTDWELDSGRKVVSRMDDDDSVCREFCQTIFSCAWKTGEHAILWSTGYVFWRGHIYLLNHPGNQFPTVVTDEMKTPHDIPHFEFRKSWDCVNASNRPGWIWVRHGIALSSTKAKYRPKRIGSIDAPRFACNLRAVARAIEPTGTPSASYAEHRVMVTERRILYHDMIQYGQGPIGQIEGE